MKLADFYCFVGRHSWKADCEKCSECGAERSNAHSIVGCRCSRCSHEAHDYESGACTRCGSLEPASVTFDPLSLHLDGCGISIKVNGTTYTYKTYQATVVVDLMAQQRLRAAEDPSWQGPFTLRTSDGDVEITTEDAMRIRHLLPRVVAIAAKLGQ